MIELIVLALLIRGYVVEPFKMPSGSMWPGIEVNDHIFVAKFVRVPDYGDVIVFESPVQPGYAYVKRALALSGDRIEFEGQQPIINGWRVPRCSIGTLDFPGTDPGGDHAVRRADAFVEYLGKYQYLVIEERDMRVPENLQFDVPSREVFVVGDHRTNSADSRMWDRGRPRAVPYDNITGRAAITGLALDETGQLDSSRFMRRFDDLPQLPRFVIAPLQTKLDQCLSHKPTVTRPPPRQQPRQQPQ